MSDFFDIDPSSGEFVFCAIEGENENGSLQTLQKKVDLKKVMPRIPDTHLRCFLQKNATVNIPLMSLRIRQKTESPHQGRGIRAAAFS